MENTSITIKEPESIATIHFQDCDPFGHLNNPRYVDYFMNARQDHIAEHYAIQILEPGGHESWVVSKSKIAYAAPAALGEKVLIRTRAIGYSEHNLRVECMMLDETGCRLKAVLWFDFVFVSLVSGRPTDHPVALMELLKVMCLDVECGDDFDRRFDYLRREHRRAQAVSPQSPTLTQPPLSGDSSGQPRSTRGMSSCR